MSRGVLYPRLLPAFARRLPSAQLEPLDHLVRWFWASSWNLPDGAVSDQEILPYAACNLAVEPTGILLTGPSTKAATHRLVGSGWVVAANLQPAASAALASSASARVPLPMRDTVLTITDDALIRDVANALGNSETFEEGVDAGVAVLGSWLTGRVGQVDGRALLANRLLAVVEEDASLRTVGHVADRLSVSPRTVQRIAHDYIGLSVGEVIRRGRLQRTLQTIRETPDEALAVIADLGGYTDQAHMAGEIRTITGQTATGYREAARAR
jgi:AraC-like DNA-binding protein